jgi:hypothetical protein
VAALLATAVVGRRADAQFPFGPDPGIVTLDSLLSSDGPHWGQVRSPHFVLYTERDARSRPAPTALLESLEAAWAHAVTRLAAPVVDPSPITVLVTRTAARFPRVLAPSSRGVLRRTSTGGELIVLVHNDSVRAFTRHEVMHAVARRVWGAPGAPWVDEGLATWADGRCQSASVLAVARDALRAEPELTAAGLPARFARGAGPFLAPRHTAYVLAASLVDFVYGRGGPEALRTTWRTGVPPGGPASATGSVTASWRRHVERAAAGQRGLSSSALAARGCG